MVSIILDSVNVAAVALIIAVCIEMGKDSLTNWRTSLIAIISLILVFYFKKLNSAFIVLAASLIGYILTFI